MSSPFTSNDLQQMAAKGITAEAIEKQIENFRDGFPYLDVVGAATPQRGITVLGEEEQKEALDAYASRSCTLAKFVPASGAASRMFKDMFAAADCLRAGGTPQECAAGKFIDNLPRFAFYTDELFAGATPLEACERLLTDKGLNYGAKPKGQLLFHRYDGEVRTAFEEHLVEGALYANTDGVVNMVVSASEEHLEGFKALLESVRYKYEKRYGVRYNVRFTIQSPATDTMAVDPDNNPFRKADGSLLFRPGGHGALIYNVNDIDADIIIIKNIDNVAKQTFIDQTVLWKKVLVGKLLQTRAKSFAYLRRLDAGEASEELRNEIVKFLDTEYCITFPKAPSFEDLRAKLDRPTRVCGMVKNVGEPGGGPFVVKDSDGCTSLQILESVQLDLSDPAAQKMFREGTHFNPVDLVCSLTDYKGNKYNLLQFVDPKAGFMSSKSYEGRPLKAQELPGLWNGAMSRWNTVFVEVPLITFNPVKTLFDLLRPEHQ